MTRRPSDPPSSPVSFACPEDVDAMPGTDARKYCSHCDKHVHDLKHLTEREARRLIAQSDSPCIRATLDAQGRVQYRPGRGTRLAMMAAAALTTAAPALAKAPKLVRRNEAGRTKPGDWSG